MTEHLLPTLAVDGDWTALLEHTRRAEVERMLPAYVSARRWFGAKARTITSITIDESIDVPSGDTPSAILFLGIHYADGADAYVLPITATWDDAANTIVSRHPHAAIARLSRADGTTGVLHDAVIAPAFTEALLTAIETGQNLQGQHGSVVASTTQAFDRLHGTGGPLPPRVIGVEQSNTSIVFGDQLIMKLFRRRDQGINPDLEIGRFLTDQASFGSIPPVAGALEYRATDGSGGSLAILQGFVPNLGDAWQYTLEQLGDYYGRVRQVEDHPEAVALSTGTLLDLANKDIGAQARALIGEYAGRAELLGRRTGEMHLALASSDADPQFAPEAFTLDYQRSILDGVNTLMDRIFRTIRDRMEFIPADVRGEAESVLAQQARAAARFGSVLQRPISAQRIRYHGDYHLGQVLYTGDDFFIIDFEGEPARPLAERRMKRSALQDVAGMLRSFHYAAYAALFAQTAQQPELQSDLEPWARAWHRWVNTLFLRSYLQTVGDAPFIPARREELELLLDIYLLEKAVYELGYELNNRPDWIKIPLQGVQQLLDS